MKQIKLFAICLLLAQISFAQKVDFSIVSVPEESGIDFVKITQDGDYVCMPQVKRSSTGASWNTSHILDISKDGQNIAYLSQRNKTTNIFIKALDKQGSSIQRTTRTAIMDFSYSPDGKFICFSEKRGKSTQIFQTSAEKGYVCRQFTNANNDFSPVYTNDMKQILFTRQENKSYSIWSYNIASNFLSSYTSGINPYPTNESTTYICSRISNEGRGEIWKINYETGVEECIISSSEHSFASPRISPCGQWVMFVGSSCIAIGEKGKYWNTDIYVARTDGTDLSQLTFHAADELSPVWSKDGQYIYFISQRGSSTGTANIWRMTFDNF